MKFTESDLQGFAKPLSATEEEKCEHAISMVRDALKGLGFDGTIERTYADEPNYIVRMRKPYSQDEVTVFLQGSYANNTNVRQHSDVDVAVVYESTFRGEYRPGVRREDYGFTASAFTGQEFKDDVEQALADKFGRAQVERGDKSIKVEGNTYRVKADCVPALRYRDYRRDYVLDESNYVGGIAIYPDSGGIIINYPEQHIQLGRDKNNATNHACKKCVRVAKKLGLMMEDQGYASAAAMSSFAIESLVFNVPNEKFTYYSSLIYTFDDVVDYLHASRYSLESFKEANDIKPLCSDGRKESDVRSFIEDLRGFYEFQD